MLFKINMCLNFAAKLQIKTENRIKLLGNFIKKECRRLSRTIESDLAVIVAVMKNSYSEPCILFYKLRDNNLSL